MYSPLLIIRVGTGEQRLGHVGPLALCHLLVIEQPVVLFPHAARFVPTLNRHACLPADSVRQASRLSRVKRH